MSERTERDPRSLTVSDYERILEYSRAPLRSDTFESRPKRNRSMRLSNRSQKHRMANVDKTATKAIRRVVYSSQSIGY